MIIGVGIVALKKVIVDEMEKQMVTKRGRSKSEAM